MREMAFGKKRFFKLPGEEWMGGESEGAIMIDEQLLVFYSVLSRGKASG